MYGYDFTNNRIVTFNAATPGTITRTLTLTGLNSGEFLVGIDFRPAATAPATNGLFAVATTGSASRVVTIDTTTGAVTGIGTGFTPAISATAFVGVDFNPVPDRIRVITNAALSLRLNPNDGTLVAMDTTLAYVAGDPNAGVTPQVVHVGYTNSTNPAPTVTTLFGIDAGTNALVRIGGVDGTPSPNLGAVTTIGPLGVDPTLFGGMDIQAGTNTAYAVLRVAGVSQLYTLNLTTGAATLVGNVGAGLTIDGLTIAPTGVSALPEGGVASIEEQKPVEQTPARLERQRLGDGGGDEAPAPGLLRRISRALFGGGEGLQTVDTGWGTKALATWGKSDAEREIARR